MDSTAFIRRWHSPAVFTLIGLCFLLPFGTVSCNGAETTFTGAQLATWNVPEGGTVNGADLGEQVEDEASTLAAITLGVAGLGLLLGVVGRRGGGWCAAVGLVTTILIGGQAFSVFGPEITLHEGYTFTLLLFLWACVLHGARAWRRRRRRPSAPVVPREPAPVEASGAQRKTDPYWTRRLAERKSTQPRSGATH
jgi:hypothetical protein